MFGTHGLAVMGVGECVSPEECFWFWFWFVISIVFVYLGCELICVVLIFKKKGHWGLHFLCAVCMLCMACAFPIMRMTKEGSEWRDWMVPWL